MLTFAGAMTGCGVIGGSSPTKTPTSTSTPTDTATPTATSTPIPPTPTNTPEPTATPAPRVEVSGDVLPQGRTVTLRVTPKGRAAVAVATYRNRSDPMLSDGDGFWLPIGAPPEAATGDLPVTITLTDAAGATLDTLRADVSVVATDFPVEAIEVPADGPNGLQPPDAVQQELNIRAEVYARFTPEKLWSGPFILPVADAITTAFGTARSYNGGPPSINHSGTDFASNYGTPVRAAAAGRVAYAGMMTTRGLSVIIDHGAGVFTAYHHLGQINVSEGQAVAQGDVVALSGMTGLATGPHVHWELVVGGVNVDPVYWTFAGIAP